jgi:hypothetical protein
MAKATIEEFVGMIKRGESDAAFFDLSLLTERVESLARLKASFPAPRDAVAHIMDTIPIVRSKDEVALTGPCHPNPRARNSTIPGGWLWRNDLLPV